MLGAGENINLVFNTKWHGTWYSWQCISIHPGHGNIAQYTKMHTGSAFSSLTIDEVIHIHYCQSLYYLCLITIGMYNKFSLSAVPLQLVHHQYHHNLYFTSIIIIIVTILILLVNHNESKISFHTTRTKVRGISQHCRIWIPATTFSI
jgi:uncharacterized membrane protein